MQVKADLDCSQWNLVFRSPIVLRFTPSPSKEHGSPADICGRLEHGTSLQYKVSCAVAGDILQGGHSHQRKPRAGHDLV